MSEHREKVLVEREVVSHFTCDACGKFIGSDDWVEIQEMLHWRMTGGYGSVFGDGARISLDLCQACTKSRLGDVIQIKEEDWGEDDPLPTH